MAELSPTQAAAVLDGLGRYEERLTWRAAGLTLMVWGIASAAIFLAYGAADPYFEEIGMPWIFAFLWLPPVAAATITTRFIWQAHAVTLQTDDEGTWLHSLLGIGGFFAVAAALFVGLDIVAGIEWEIATIMVLANGLFAGVEVAMERRFYGATNKATLGAAAFMLLGGLAMGLIGVAEEASGLVGGLIVLVGWCTAGYITYKRG